MKIILASVECAENADAGSKQENYCFWNLRFRIPFKIHSVEILEGESSIFMRKFFQHAEFSERPIKI